MAITKLTNSGLSGDKYPNLMADNTFMEPIATTLVGSGGSSAVTFSNIPQIYRHLQIRYIAKNSNTANGNNINFQVGNGSVDGGANYTFHQLYADGASVGSSGSTGATSVAANQTTGTSSTNIFSVSIIDILDYTNQNKYKTFRILGGWDANGSGNIQFRSSVWLNTAPINIITMVPDPTRTFQQYTRFSLYGIRG